MQQLANRINRSKALNRLITFLSVRLAHYRGVPILIGVVLAILSWPLHLIAILTGLTGWYIAAFSILHLAIIFGLVGILMAEPLGKG